MTRLGTYTPLTSPHLEWESLSTLVAQTSSNFFLQRCLTWFKLTFDSQPRSTDLYSRIYHRQLYALLLH